MAAAAFFRLTTRIGCEEPPSLGISRAKVKDAILFVWNDSQTVFDRIPSSVVAGNLLRSCFLGFRRYGTSQYYDFLVLERVDINSAGVDRLVRDDRAFDIECLERASDRRSILFRICDNSLGGLPTAGRADGKSST
jgi:hypothetical protein